MGVVDGDALVEKVVVVVALVVEEVVGVELLLLLGAPLPSAPCSWGAASPSVGLSP